MKCPKCGGALLAEKVGSGFCLSCGESFPGELLDIASGSPYFRLVNTSLANENKSLLRSVDGHNNAWISGIAISPDGKYVISAGWDCSLKVWALSDGSNLATLKDHNSPVESFAITADGHYAISGDYEGSMRVWDLQNYELITAFQGHTSSVNAIAVTSDGQHIVSGGDDNKLKIWSVGNWQEIRSFEHPDGDRALAGLPGIKSIVQGHDGYIYVVGGFSGIWVCHVFKEDTPFTIFDSLRSSYQKIALIPGTNKFIIADGDTLILFPLFGLFEGLKLEGHRGWVQAIAVTDDGHYAISGGDDKILRIWDIQSGVQIAQLMGHCDKITGIALSHDGLHAVSCSLDGTLKYWCLTDASNSQIPSTSHSGKVTVIDISADGRYAVSGSDDKNLKLWDIESGEQLATLSGHAHAISAAVFNNDGRIILSASLGDKIKTWDVAFRMERTESETYYWGGRNVIAMSKKPFVIAVSSTFLKVWNIQSGEEEFSYEEIKSSRNQCLVSICSTPDERYLIYGDNKKKMTVWDMSSWQKIAFLVPPMDGYKKTPFLIGYTPNWYSPVAVTPDGQYAISGGHDGSLIVWHVHSGVVLKFLRGNTKNEATAIAVSPDGKYLASAHYDDLIFWDLETHRELATFKEHRGTIMSLSFSCDARYVISVGDRTVIIWDLIKRANVGVFRTQGEISAFASFGFQRFVFGYNTGQVCILQLEGVK